MRNRAARATVWLVLAISACRTPDPHAGEPTVHRLAIHGARQVPAREIEKRLATGATSWIPFSHPEHFDPDVWRTDLKRIERIYRERGYYQARVTGVEERRLSHNRVDLTVQVDEGEPTRITAVDVRGLDALAPAQRDPLIKALSLRVGDVFIEDVWEAAKTKLVSGLHDAGWADATVDGVAEVDLATQAARLRLDVQTGERLKFGRIEVSQQPGARVEPWRAQEKAEEDVRPGDWYSDAAQRKAEDRLLRMGVFGAVKVSREPTDESTGTVPMDVDLRESPFHSLRYGVGVGLDETRSEGHVKAEYSNRDFLGTLRVLTLSGTAGYAFVPGILSGVSTSVGEEQGPIAKLSAQLTQPRLFHPDVQLLTKAEVERGIEPAYSFFGGKAQIGVTWEPVHHLRIEPSYHVEAYRLDQGIANLAANAPPLLFGCPEVCVLSYLEERISWDARDDILQPREGYWLSFAIQEGGGPLGGTFEYLKLEPDLRGYVSFGEAKRLTLAGRVHIGTLLPSSGNDLDSPIVARFFSGGNEMRGFSTTRLSPMYIEPNPATGQTYSGVAVPIGGNGLFEASLEARWNAWGPLWVALFTDTGFVTTQQFDFSEARYISRNLLYAFGLGARYRTPVGPIRLDFAYRPNWGPPLEVYGTGQGFSYYSPLGCFGLGGHNGTRAGSPEDPCAIQLSIGEAF